MFNKDNPWLNISASDYEGHMRSPEVGQMQFLSNVFGELMSKYTPRTLAVIGCAAGNGFERINSGQVDRVIGIDINPDFIALAQTRFAKRLPQLELICGDLLGCRIEGRSLDFIFAGLILEYVDAEAAVSHFTEWLKPHGLLAVVLQLPSDQGKVTATKYTSLICLEPVINLVEPDRLTAIAEQYHLRLRTSRIETLPSGKSFFVGEYEREQ
jgi:ubiquinone/menaquinone biosynthesis C-methylase UbiE